MPYSDPHPSDPHSLVGVEVPASQEASLDMAYVIAEEFARLGFGEERLMHLFQNPFYQNAHQALKIVGEEKIESIIREALEIWGRCQLVDQDSAAPLVQLEGIRQKKEEVSHE